jgi:beta-glucanase (GH16 family)
MCFFKPKPKPPAPILFDPATSGYALAFREDWKNGIDWNKWDHTLAYGQDQKGVTKWTRECVVLKEDGVHLIAKRGVGINLCGQITTWKFLDIIPGDYVSFVAKVPPGGFLYFAALWAHNKFGWQPEWDFLEMTGKTSKFASFTHHAIAPDGVTNIPEGITWESPVDLSLDFHTYSGLWLPDRLIWHVDGVQRYVTTNNTPTIPMYLLCGIQSGGPEGGYEHLFTPEESGAEMIIGPIEIWKKP